jgi:glycosyltransferase involved in cell wall biosynthesis
MHAGLMLNNPNDPLISILIYDYDAQNLRKCLESIFNQDVLKNFELVLIDDASIDGSWDTALEFQRKYPGRITIQRNRRVLGPSLNLCYCKQMAKGTYCVTLTENQIFLPEYIRTCVQTMLSDPHAEFQQVFHREDPLVPLPCMLNKPLVSILCYNYNYGRYLRQCLESVFAQTYENIELCFSDNASTDESWGIALEFARKYAGKTHVTRNRRNFGSDDNLANCRRLMKGKYWIILCSDDALAPEYVESCVNALEANPNAGLAIVNRAIIDENSRRTEEPPFYNQSCIIPGEEQAAVYMMAGVNPSISQIMYRHPMAYRGAPVGSLVQRYYGTRLLDFNVSLDFDIAYITEPLLLHRIHSQSDTSQADANLLPVLGLYVLNHQFADIASVRNLTKVTGRLPASLDKLARLGIRYSVRSLLARDEQSALRYFHLAAAINPQVADDPAWRQLQEYWTADSSAKAGLLDHFGGTDNLAARTVSYEPPPGSIPISSDGRALHLASRT